MKENAQKIAGLIAGTDTDSRGYLLKEVADILRLKDQYYTSMLIMKIAKEYGFDEQGNK